MDHYIIITEPGKDHLIETDSFYGDKWSGGYEKSVVACQQLEKKYPNVYFSVRRVETA
jgi:hypothetical protein